jgi:hypothetical protein
MSAVQFGCVIGQQRYHKPENRVAVGDIVKQTLVKIN